MVGLLGSVDFSGFGNALNIGVTILVAVVIGALIFLVINLFINQGKYKHRVIAWRLVGGKKQFFLEKAKEVKDKDGNIRWRLKLLKKLVSPPSSDCIDTDLKGRMIAHGSVDSNKQWTWAKLDYDFEKYKDTSASFEPISTESKANFAYQQQFNKSLSGFKFLEQYGGVITTGFFLVIMLVVVGLLWGRLSQPALDAQEERTIQLKVLNEIVATQAEISTGIRNLESGIVANSEAISDLENSGVPGE